MPKICIEGNNFHMDDLQSCMGEVEKMICQKNMNKKMSLGESSLIKDGKSIP